ncbi:response regulator [Pedobacter mucosus]|uniref:response regulator n=1 Tax=Pedobacter mucosus TaxID=2895286 RepID=UPI001EE3ABDC|nr:response regulator [Pedobacter mucosus]UKT66024.1 response regulator [Pedobacter mucosus]
MRRILVLDDSTDILFILQLLLEEEGYEVKCIEDALNLMPLVIDFKPELIIMDIQLGRYDGRALCEHLKVIEQTRDIPIVMMSAKTNILEMNGYTCKAQEFITKPFDIDYMVKTVSYHLGK